MSPHSSLYLYPHPLFCSLLFLLSHVLRLSLILFLLCLCSSHSPLPYFPMNPSSSPFIYSLSMFLCFYQSLILSVNFLPSSYTSNYFLSPSISLLFLSFCSLPSLSHHLPPFPMSLFNHLFPAVCFSFHFSTSFYPLPSLPMSLSFAPTPFPFV